MGSAESASSYDTTEIHLIAVRREAPCYVTCQNVVKCSLHVGRVQGGGFDKTEVVFLSEGLGLLGWHSPQVPQVRLVTNLG